MRYNSYSPAFSAIIIYIIFILIIIILKPNIIYDHQNKKFREFGFSGDKSMVTLMILGIISSFIIYNFVLIFMPSHRPKYNNYSSYDLW